jgi:hypothetical protein
VLIRFSGSKNTSPPMLRANEQGENTWGFERFVEKKKASRSLRKQTAEYAT